VFKCKKLTYLQDSPFASSIEHTRNFLAKLQNESIPGIDNELLQQLDEEQLQVRSEIDRLRARVDVLKSELESIWQNCTEAAYELTSVFIHRGSSPSWGHYFFYSRHLPGSPDSWFKYNDSDVTVVSKEEVLADTTGSTANPYLVCYFSLSHCHIADPNFVYSSSSLGKARTSLTLLSVLMQPC